MNALNRGLVIFLIMVFVTACGGSGSGNSNPSTVQISWNSNPETSVNSSGGGYKIYYSLNTGFAITDAGVTVVDVPYSSGTIAPKSAQIKLSSGTYYIRIQAYSILDAPGSSGGSVSTATPQTTLIMP